MSLNRVVNSDSMYSYFRCANGLLGAQLSQVSEVAESRSGDLKLSLEKINSLP